MYMVKVKVLIGFMFYKEKKKKKLNNCNNTYVIYKK